MALLLLAWLLPILSTELAAGNIAYKNSLFKYPLALCLNGTPGVYYFSSGFGDGRRKFLIHEEGGGSCKFGDGSEAPRGGDAWERNNSCLHRALHEGSYGGTAGAPDVMDLCGPEAELSQAGFDRNAVRNPLLYDWNHVFVRYCDGGYFSGNRSDLSLGLHYRGAEILSSVFFDLKQKHGLDHASDIVLSGCSAGGIAIFAHLDWAAKHPAIPKAARFSGFPIEGFYMDDSEWRPGVHSGHQLEGMGIFTYLKRAVYELHKPDAVLNSGCLRTYLDKPYLCLVASASAPFIRSELFFWQSKFDEDMLAWQPNYGAYESEDGICLKAGGDYNNLSDIDVDCANRLGNQMTQQMNRLWTNSPHIGGFLDACYHHCTVVQPDIRIDATSPLHAFAEWYGGGRQTWNDKRPWDSTGSACLSPLSSGRKAAVAPRRSW